MKKIIILILVAVAFASAKDYAKVFIQLIDNLKNCELSRQDTANEFFGPTLYFGCDEDTVELHLTNDKHINGISINTVEYYEGVKITAYRFFISSGKDTEGNPYKGSYNEIYYDDFGITVYDVQYRLNKDLDVAKIYTYFRQKMTKKLE